MSKCKVCRALITEKPVIVGLNKLCSIECASELALKNLEKHKKAEKTKQRKALKAFNDKDINILKRKAIQVFNTYIRKRDEHRPCVSCGYSGDKRQWHAGHYKPAGNFAQLRFDESNVHKQCSICNNHLSGNLVEYLAELYVRIGVEEVERLNTTREPKSYTIEEYAEIIRVYKLKLKGAECLKSC